MPLFDYQCPRCKHEWEALIVNSGDEHLKMCPKCAIPGKRQMSTGVSWTIWGFAERNGYGLKKFVDEKPKT